MANGAHPFLSVCPWKSPLTNTCATQLLNAGCRVTSIQRFLGHKELGSTMIYARVLDKTVAEDYFKAMEQVEQQLDLSLDNPSQHTSPGEVLALVEELINSPLSLAQTEIVYSLRTSLSQWVMGVCTQRLSNGKR